MEKFFTIEEANAVLPFAKESFARIARCKESLAAIEADIELLADIWGDTIHQQTNPDHRLYAEKMRIRQKEQQTLHTTIEQLHHRGCVVKDIAKGLIDFYYQVEDDVIFLCWQQGEDEIRYWHDLHAGFAGRRPLSELRIPSRT